MKKIVLTIAIVTISNLIYSQGKGVKEIEKNYLLGKIEPCKEIADKLAADPANQNNAEVWLWKSTIDAEISNDENLSPKCADCLNSSFAAFKKYESLENSLKLLSELPFKWKPLGIMYDKYYNNGREFYKNKNWESAFENFDKSAYFAKIIMKKNIRNNNGALDTLPILMSGYAAQNAQKLKEALAYYSIAADAKFGNDGDIDMYKYLLVGYSDLKDKASFEKYFTIATEKYPKENFEDYKLDFISKNLSLDEKIATYDADESKGIISASGYMNFGDMFVNFKKEDKEILEKDAAKKAVLQGKAREAFKKAYSKNNDPLAAFNAGVLYYNEFNDTDDKMRANIKAMQEINANKPVEKDAKKKAAADAKVKAELEPLKKANAALETSMNGLGENAIEWLEKAFSQLNSKTEKSKQEKSSFKNILKFLGAIYEFKREKSRGKDPKAYDAFDAKSKMYYDLYDKS